LLVSPTEGNVTLLPVSSAAGGRRKLSLLSISPRRGRRRGPPASRRRGGPGTLGFRSWRRRAPRLRREMLRGGCRALQARGGASAGADAGWGGRRGTGAAANRSERLG
jgi:hypothetical protein